MSKRLEDKAQSVTDCLFLIEKVQGLYLFKVKTLPGSGWMMLINEDARVGYRGRVFRPGCVAH